MNFNSWYQAFPEDIKNIKQMKMILAPSLGIGSSTELAMLKESLPNYIKKAVNKPLLFNNRKVIVT